MESIMVVSGREIDCEDLKSLVSVLGGRWNNDPTVNQGVIQQGSSTVYCNPAKAACTEYPDEEIAELADRIRDTPRTVVVIDIGHGQDSADLAVMLADSIVQRWGGLIDDNGILD